MPGGYEIIGATAGVSKMSLVGAFMTSLLLGAGTLGFVWPHGCGSGEVTDEGYAAAEKNALIIASGKNGDTRRDIGEASGSLVLKGVESVSGEFSLQDTMKNGFSWYKNDEKQCSIEHSASSVARARRLNNPFKTVPEWEVTCGGEVQFQSYFDTTSGPTGGWQAAPGVDEKVPSFTLAAGILVPEGSEEKYVQGPFVISGLVDGRPSYKNMEGCQIFYKKTVDSQDEEGEWRLMCWAECDHSWQVLYKVPDSGIHHLPPLNRWEVIHGTEPAPTFAVLDATDPGQIEPSARDSQIEPSKPAESTVTEKPAESTVTEKPAESVSAS